jgi:hypothetical protein
MSFLSGWLEIFDMPLHLPLSLIAVILLNVSGCVNSDDPALHDDHPLARPHPSTFPIQP